MLLVKSYITFQLILLSALTFGVPLKDDKEKEILKNQLKLLSSKIDSSIEPCTEIHKYICRQYSAQKELKDEYFTVYWDVVLKQIFAKESQLSEPAQKAKLYYETCRNSTFDDIFQKFSSLKNLKWPQVKGVRNFDWIQAVAKLHAMKDAEIFLDLSYVPHISINFATLFIDKKKVYNAMIKHGARPQHAKEAIEQIEQFIERLEKVLDTYEAESNQEPPVSNITYSELKSNVKFDFDKFFDYAIGHIPKETDYINVINMLKLEKLLPQIAQEDPRTVINYIFMGAYVDFASEETCAAETVELFNPVVITEAKKLFQNERDQENFIKAAKYFLLSIEPFKDFYQPESYEDANIDYIKSEFEFLNTQYNEKIANDELKDVSLIPGNYFDNLYIAKRNLRKLIVTGKAPVHQKGGFSASYMLQTTAFYHNKPMFYFFATDTQNRWRQVLKDAEYDNKYFSILNCFEAQAQRYNMSTSNLGNDILETTTLHRALSVYKNYTSETGEDFKDVFNEFKLSQDKAFFLVYAQNLCSEKDDLLERIFANTPAFAEAFECPVRSRLNPEFKCSVL